MAEVRRVAVVCPYSAGAWYHQALRMLGCECVAVTAGAAPPAGAGPGSYAAVVPGRGDRGAVAAALREAGVTAVLAGDETGIGSADGLAAALGLPGNDPATTAIRRDKHLMHAALQAAGVPHADTVRARSVDEALRFWRSRGGRPAVVKPLASAGTDSVRICYSPGDIRAAWGTAIGRTGQTGLVNTALAVQEHLEGQQYVCNTVSSGGLHHVTEVWRDQRQVTAGGRPVYDRADLLPPGAPVAAAIVAYTFRVLDALGVRYGPAHCEIMMTGRGPVLIEINARLSGGHDPSAIARREGQVYLAAEAAADPAAFAARDSKPYAMTAGQVTQLNLIAAGPAVTGGRAVLDEEHARAILALPAVASALHLRPGAPVRETTDEETSPGFCTLRGTPAEVEAAVAAIRGLERDGLLYRGAGP
jgi:biotin carboxylase